MRLELSQLFAFLLTWVVATIEGSDAFFPPASFHRPLTLLRGGSDNPINSGELVSTLARLDQQWKIQQSQRRGPKSRWTKILLDVDGDDADTSADEPQSILTQGPQDFVYLLEPTSVPSCVIVFLGGAGLGQFPHIAYNELLLRVSDRLNAAVLAAPYTVGLDHFSIAKQAGEKLRKGIVACQDDKQYSQNLPIYCFGHSLGCKLQAIYMAATSQDFNGVGFISFNNFSFSQTIGMARDFADQIRKASNKSGSSGIPGSAEGVLNQLFGLAETAVGAIGLDFVPSPDDMRRLLQLKYANDWKQKTRLFCFDDDTLDSTSDFVASCGYTVTVSGLPGSHLTPVFLQLKLEEYMTELPEEAREMASQAMDGFQGASFGNEEELNILVDEICAFVLGKPPSRPAGKTDVPLIAGGEVKGNA